LYLSTEAQAYSAGQNSSTCFLNSALSRSETSATILYLSGLRLTTSAACLPILPVRDDFVSVGVAPDDFRRLPAYIARTAYESYFFHLLLYPDFFI